MGNCMKSKGVVVEEPQQVDKKDSKKVHPQQVSSQIQQQYNQNIIQSDQMLQNLTQANEISNENGSKNALNVVEQIQEVKPVKELSKIQLMKLQKKKEQQKLKQNEQIQPLFDYLVEKAQEENPSEVDFEKVSQLMDQQNSKIINQIVTHKEISGCTLSDYCFQNQHIYILRFVFERLKIEELSLEDQRYQANVIFKALISSSKLFNRRPEFFFSFLDLIENNGGLGKLFLLYLGTANPYCFLQFINLESEQAQLFLDRVKELIQKSIENEGDQKEIELLNVVLKIQQNFLLDQFFVKLNLPKDMEVLKKNLNDSNLKSYFTDIQFDISKERKFQKQISMIQSTYNFANFLVSQKRLDLIQQNWSVYLQLLLEKDSSRSTGASIILQRQKYDIISNMIEVYQDNENLFSQFLKISNNRNQNIIHFIIGNKNLSSDNIITIIQQIFHKKQEEKESLLLQYDSLNSIPLTYYLNQKDEQKNINLIKILTPAKLNSNQNKSAKYPLLTDLQFPLFEFQVLQQMSIPGYIWKVYPKIQQFYDTVDALNIQILESIFTLKNQRNEIFNMIGKNLCLIFKNSKTEYLQELQDQIFFEKFISDQGDLDKDRWRAKKGGEKEEIIKYLESESYISQKINYKLFIKRVVNTCQEPSSALQTIVLMKFKQEFLLLDFDENRLKQYLDQCFEQYINQLEQFDEEQKLQQSQSLSSEYFNHQLGCLKDQKYFNKIKQIFDDIDDPISHEDLQKFRIQQQLYLIEDHEIEQNVNKLQDEDIDIKYKQIHLKDFNLDLSVIFNLQFEIIFRSKFRDEFITMISEQLFNNNIDYQTIFSSFISTARYYQIVIRSPQFKKILIEKRIKSINQDFLIKYKENLIKIILECTKVDDKESQELIQKNYNSDSDNFSRLRLDFSNEKDYLYYKENGQKIIQNLIKCDLLGQIKMILPYRNSFQINILQSLKQSNDVYENLFYELMVTSKNVFQILFSNEKYMKILLQINQNQKNICQSLKSNVYVAVHTSNLAAVKWICSTNFPQEIDVDEENKLCFDDLFYDSTFYPLEYQFSEDQAEITEEYKNKKRNTQWNIFKEIKLRFGEDLTRKCNFNRRFLNLYEHFGLKFSVNNKDFDSQILHSDYVDLVTIIKQIKIYGEQTYRTKNQKQEQLLRNDQIEFIIQQFFKQAEEIYKDLIENYYKKSDQTIGQITLVYYSRLQLIDSMYFIQEYLFSHVTHNKNIQQQLLNLGNQAILQNDSVLLQIINKMFCQVIQENKLDNLTVSQYLNQIMYSFWLQFSLGSNQKNHFVNFEDMESNKPQCEKFQNMFFIQKTKSTENSKKKLLKKQGISLQPQIKKNYCWHIQLHQITNFKLSEILKELIYSSLISSNEKLLINLVRIVSLIYFNQKSEINKFFSVFSGYKSKLNDFVYFIQGDNPIFFSRYFANERFENIVKVMHEEYTKEFFDNALTQENQKRTQFIIKNAFKDVSRHGQIKQWEVLYQHFKEILNKDSELDLIQCFINAYAGRLSQIEQTQNQNKENEYLFSDIRNFVSQIFSLRYCKDILSSANVVNYSKIIQNCLKILSEQYQKSLYPLKFEYVEKRPSKFDYISNHSLEYIINILYLSLIYHFEDTFKFVKYLHQRNISNDKQQEGEEDKESKNENIQKEETQKGNIWKKFIINSIKYGALSYTSIWNKQQLRQFLDHFEKDYLNIITQEIPKQLEQREVSNDDSSNEDDNTCGIIPFNSKFSEVNQEYLSFFIRNKNNLTYKNKQILSSYLDYACLKSISFFNNSNDQKSYTKKYLLDAMKEFGIKLNNIDSSDTLNVKKQKFYSKICLDLSSRQKKQQQQLNIISNQNKLNEYLIILSDEDLEYALSLGLFNLFDQVIARVSKKQIQFLKSNQKLKSLQQNDDKKCTIFNAIQYALVLGRLNFISLHQNILIETLISNNDQKLETCCKYALLSGRLDIFKLFFEKINNFSQKFQFLKDQKILFQLTQLYMGSESIFRYLVQNYYCNKQFISQNGKGNELLEFNDLIFDKCIVLKNLAIMQQEEVLLEIFSYILNNYPNEKIQLLTSHMCYKQIEVEEAPTENELDTKAFSVFDSFYLFQLHNLRCFLIENRMINFDDVSTNKEFIQNLNRNLSKKHQEIYLESKHLVKIQPSRSELYTHLNIIFKLLFQELTSYQVNLPVIQMLENSLFGFVVSQKHLEKIYESLSFFIRMQLTQIIYTFCEIFNINLQNLISNNSNYRESLQKSELFNIYLLKHSLYPDINIIKVIQGNPSYFKNCRMAQFLNRLNEHNIQPSITYLHSFFSHHFSSVIKVSSLIEGEEKYQEIQKLINKQYYQKELIKVLCDKEQLYITTNEEIFNTILQDASLAIYLLKDNPLTDEIVKNFVKEINDNREQYQLIQKDKYDKTKFKTELQAKVTADFQKEFSDSPFNKVLRSLVYYFSVQKCESLIDIFEKVFLSINIFSKQGISFQYHLLIIKNAREMTDNQGNTIQSSKKDDDNEDQNTKITEESIRELAQGIIYEQLIKGSSEFNSNQIKIYFNNIFADIYKFVSNQNNSIEKQYSLLFQTVFRFFQTIYSLRLAENFSEKQLEISLLKGDEPIQIEKIDEFGLSINLFYDYNNEQFKLNASDVQPLKDQVENYYFFEKNMPFIEQQIELFNNRKDRLIRQSQFGEIPFTFDYESIQHLDLIEKREILNQIELRSQESLQNEFKKQFSQNSQALDKVEQHYDSNTYFGLYSLVEEISMYLSFLNIKQKEFYALNDMFAPHNNAMMNPIEQQSQIQLSTTNIPSHQQQEAEYRNNSQTMIGSQFQNMNSRIGQSQVRENQNVLNSIKMQGAIFSYYLEQLPDNTYKVNLKKNSTISKSPSNQLLFSEFYEFCPFKEGKIDIVYIPYDEFLQKTQTQSIYNTLLAQVISYERRFMCALKNVQDQQNLDSRWYYSINKDKQGNAKIVSKKELFAGYNLLRIKQMMNDFENELSFGKKEEISQKWKINVQSLLEVIVSGLFNIAQGSTAYDCERCSIDRDSIFSLFHYILSSPLLKKIIHIILYQNFSDSGNIMKVIKGIYFEFNEVEMTDLPEECKLPDLDQYLEYGLDQIIRIGKTAYYIHKFMLVIRINLCFIKNDLSLIQINQNKKSRTEDLILKEIPILKNYIQVITNQYDFYEQIFTPEQTVSFILNKLEIDNHLLAISKNLSKQFSQSQTITFNINYESLYHIFNNDFNKAKSIVNPIKKIEQYDKIWKGLNNLKNYLLDQLEKNLYQQLDQQSYQDQFYMIFQNLIYSYENKQMIKKRLVSNFRTYPILTKIDKDKNLKQNKQENDNFNENDDEFDDLDISEDIADSTNKKISASQIIQSIYQIRSQFSNIDQLKNGFLIQLNLNDFLLHAKKGDHCFIGYYSSNQNSSDYLYTLGKISERTDKKFTFESFIDYRNTQEILQENIKFALLHFQTWPNPQLFSGQIEKYCIIDSSLKIQLINSKALSDICQFFMSEDNQNNLELLEQFQGYLYRGSDNLTQEISLNSLIQLMPSNISFVFERNNQDHLNDHQFDLLNLQKQQSTLIRNQFDMFDNHIKQVIFKFDENYKFKKPILTPDQFSFASSVDSNQRIQEEYSSLIHNLTTLFSQTLLKESQLQEIYFDFDYDPELENMRAVNIELIEMNISFICYNIFETFNSVTNYFNNFSPQFLKQILLLAYHNKNSRTEFYNESDIVCYLFMKLLVKHINRIGLQFRPIPEQNSEDLQLVEYVDSSKSFNIIVYIGKKLDQIIIPSTNDISYNLLKLLVICEFKYVSQKKYLSKHIDTNQLEAYQINSDLKDFNFKITNDLKSFSNLHLGEYQVLIVQLMTLSFSIKSLSIISSMQNIDSSQLYISFNSKLSSSFQKSQDQANKGVQVQFGFGSLNFTTEFFDIIHVLGKDDSQYLNVLFKNHCSIDIQNQIEATSSTQIVISQSCSQQLNEQDLQQITNEQNYQVKMIDLSDLTQLTIFDVKQVVYDQQIQLKLKQDLSHLQGKGNHYLYVIFFNKQAISYNYLLKNSDEFIQQLLQQNNTNDYKINQDSIVIIQQKSQINTNQSLFDGINIQLNQMQDESLISLSSYAQRYTEIVKNKKIRLIKINKDKSSKMTFFTFDINSRFISNDTLILTIRNSRSQTLNIQNNFQAIIISNSGFPKEIISDLQIKFSSTSKILIEKTQLKGCVIENQKFQAYSSKKDKQKKDNQKMISPLFKIFQPKTVTRLIESGEEIEFIESVGQLKRYQEIQRQVFMEDGRQSLYSRAGETRKDALYFYDGFGNVMQPTEPLENYQVIFVHILFSQIKFKGKLSQSKVQNEFYCEWRPLIKGSYRMYINSIYIPQSEEMIGIIANTIDDQNIKIERSEISLLSYYDTMECQVYYKDIYGNNYTQFDKTTSNDHLLLEIKCAQIGKSKQQNLEFSFSLGIIDKVGKQKVTLKFDPKQIQNLHDPNPQKIAFIYSQKQLHEFSLTVQGMNFEKRKKQFQEAIQKFKKNTSGQSVKINRDKFAEELLTNFENFDLRNSLYINFKDEKGIDAGGLRREFYELVGKMMKDSTYQFFELSSGQTTEKYFFHKNCLKMKQSVQYFKIFGKFIAHTILYEALLGIEFCEPIYKLITKQEIQFEDLKHVLDLQTYKNYLMLKDFDAEGLEDMCLFFTYSEKGKGVELIPNGSQIQVTKDNLDQYLKETSQYLLQKRFQNAITHLQEGFESVFSSDILLKFIHPNELSIYTCGLREIDGAFLQKLSTFSGGNSILQSYYYRYLSESTTQMLQNFLKFITGSGSIPFDYSNFKLVIDFISGMNLNKLPLSHTCFRSIEVPHYKSYEQMKSKFDLAFTLGSEGFAFG